MVAAQIKVPVDAWHKYGQRAETRREHLLELQSVFGFRTFATRDYRPSVLSLNELAWQTDKGIVLATALVDGLRRQSVLLPTSNVIERVCAEAITRANRRIHAALTESLTTQHCQRLDELPQRKEGSKTTQLGWLRQSAAKPNSRHMREHIDRLKTWQALDLPAGVERQVHHNGLLKIARVGGQLTPADLAKFEPQRRYATLVARPSRAPPPSPTKSSTCTTASSASCSPPPRTSINSSSSRRARRSTTRYGSTHELARRCSMRRKAAATLSRRSRS